MVALFGGSSSNNPAKGQHGEMYRLVSSVASEAMGIGKSSDVLTVLGGKASCRRKFVLNVHLVDDHGNLVSRDLAIVASVAYAHDHSPVVRDEKPFLAEPPLFTTFNGVEFPAQDRPTRMVSGRASFKLAISLLSSKCDNRLFCICFTPQPSGGGDGAPICAPCYSKPIRSISRKRTQSSTHVSPTPPLLLLAGLEASPPPTASAMRSYTNNGNHVGGGGGGGSFESNGVLGAPKFGASPTTSSENDGKGAVSPVRPARLQCSSRSSSVTSMHYLSPTSAAGLGGSAGGGMMDEGGGRNGCKGGGPLVLHESPASAHSIAGTVGSLSAATPPRGGAAGGGGGGGGGIDRFNETDPSGSSTGGMASVSCSPVSSNPPPANNYCSESMKVTSPPCSLSLRLSPSDSGSPTSGALTSESSYDNKQQPQQQDPAAATARTQSSPLAAGSSRPTFNGPNVPQPAANNNARPFRPYATVGPCKVPMGSDFQLGNGISLATPPAQSLNCNKRSNDGGGGGGGQASTNTLLERVHQLCAVSPVGRHQLGSGGKVDSMLHSFSLGTDMRGGSNADDKFNSALTEISLEEEEKSLQYIEVSLQEVGRELQRRKEELRCKRRRLLEDEARMHSIIFQSSSWIESLSGRFSM